MADLDGTRSTEISATAERCFTIAADLDHLPEWHGAITAVEILERDDAGRGTLIESEMDVNVTKVHMQLRFSYDEPSAVRWTRESGDLKTMEGSWRFEEGGNGLTVATYALEIGVGRRLALLVKTVRGPVRDRVESLLVDRPVEGLKARAEGS
jgi:ribosome-associated toxin RatA of RatAB toxin-antitoxin module